MSSRGCGNSSGRFSQRCCWQNSSGSPLKSNRNSKGENLIAKDFAAAPKGRNIFSPGRKSWVDRDAGCFERARLQSRRNIPLHCHPERSGIIRSPDDTAESKDLLFACAVPDLAGSSLGAAVRGHPQSPGERSHSTRNDEVLEIKN